VIGLELLQSPARQAGAAQQTEHRPWPLPERPWLLAQTVKDVLLAHWRVPAPQLRALLPEGLELDLHPGEAWMSVTPTRLTSVRLRGTLPLPLVSGALEVGVRTYVTADDRPGVWLFSVDVSSALAAEAGRRLFGLPLHRARMSTRWHAGWLEYESARSDAARPFVLSGRFRATGPAETPEPGSLERFLAERFCLYVPARGGSLRRAEMHHAPWPLQPAEAELELNTVAPDGLDAGVEEPLLHFVGRHDLLLWAPT